jgi:hypothetical protein
MASCRGGEHSSVELKSIRRLTNVVRVRLGNDSKNAGQGGTSPRSDKKAP